MQGKIDRHTEEFARQYVLGALASEQAREFESKLQTNAELAAFVHDIAQVSAAVAKTLVWPDAPARIAAIPEPTQGTRAAPSEREPSSQPNAAAPSISQGRFWFMLNSGRQNWKALAATRCSVQELELSESYAVLLLHMQPHASYPAHGHSGSEETYVLSGDVSIAGQLLREGDFHHADPRSVHGESSTTQGCLLLMVVSRHDHALHWSEPSDVRVNLHA